ncbi:MAG: hypothetical protein ACPG5U_04395 [Planktomarina sp.]
MKTPIHFWILAVLGLLWFGMGAYDYVMTVRANEEYLSILTPEQRVWMDARPMWFTVFWATSIWAAVLGCIVMLVRRRAAGKVFLISIAAYIPCLTWSYVISDPSGWDVTGMFGLVFSVIIGLTIIFFAMYCSTMARRGVLR